MTKIDAAWHYIEGFRAANNTQFNLEGYVRQLHREKWRITAKTINGAFNFQEFTSYQEALDAWGELDIRPVGVQLTIAEPETATEAYATFFGTLFNSKQRQPAQSAAERAVATHPLFAPNAHEIRKLAGGDGNKSWVNHIIVELCDEALAAQAVVEVAKLAHVPGFGRFA